MYVQANGNICRTDDHCIAIQTRRQTIPPHASADACKASDFLQFSFMSRGQANQPPTSPHPFSQHHCTIQPVPCSRISTLPRSTGLFYCILPGPLSCGCSPYLPPRLYKGEANTQLLARSSEIKTNCCHELGRLDIDILMSKHLAQVSPSAALPEPSLPRHQVLTSFPVSHPQWNQYTATRRHLVLSSARAL